MTFKSISKNASRCENIRPGDELMRDVNAGNLANFMLYTPDLDSDGHDTNVTYTSNWLKGFLEPLVNHPNMNDTLVSSKLLLC